MIVRAKDREKWTVTSNMPVRDPHLPPDALGVLTYLLSFSDNWKPLPEDIQRRFNIGEKRTYRILRDLKKAGYLEKRVRRSTTGIIIFQEYIVYEEPIARQAPAAKSKPAINVVEFPKRRKAQ
jgi:hypothetical protein